MLLWLCLELMLRIYSQSTEVETRAFSLCSGKNTTLPAPPPALHTWTLETTRKNGPKQRAYLEQTTYLPTREQQESSLTY